MQSIVVDILKSLDSPVNTPDNFFKSYFGKGADGALGTFTTFDGRHWTVGMDRCSEFYIKQKETAGALFSIGQRISLTPKEYNLIEDKVLKIACRVRSLIETFLDVFSNETLRRSLFHHLSAHQKIAVGRVCKQFNAMLPQGFSRHIYSKEKILPWEQYLRTDFLDVEKALQCFAEKLFQCLEKSSNIDAAFSPISIFFTIGMLLTCFKEHDKAILLQQLGLSHMSEGQFHTALHEIMREFDDDDCLISNALVLTKDIVIKEQFLSLLSKNYDITSFTSQTDEEFLIKINGWIKQITKGAIPQMLKSFDETTLAAFVNVAYFKGEWKEKFDASQTRLSPFFKENGSLIQRRFMNLELKEFKFFQSEKEEIFLELPYTRQDISCCFLLPPKGQQVSQFVNQFSLEKLNLLRNTTEKVKIGELSIPLMELKTALQAEELLLQAGLNMETPLDCFENRVLQSDSNLGQAQIAKKINHEALILFSEEGTIATAATIAALTAMGKPVHHHARFNRPFIFILMKGNYPFFMGVIKEGSSLKEQHSFSHMIVNPSSSPFGRDESAKLPELKYASTVLPKDTKNEEKIDFINRLARRKKEEGLIAIKTLTDGVLLRIIIEDDNEESIRELTAYIFNYSYSLFKRAASSADIFSRFS